MRAKKEAGDRPSMIVLDTVKGKGVPFIEEMGFANHCIPFPRELMERALAELDRKAGV
jgi:transketolase